MDEHPQQPLEPSVSVEELGPAIASPDDVIDTILEISTGGAPRTALVAGLSSQAQSAQTAIGIARDLAGRNAQVALVDLAKGSAVVSGQLSMPRVPGFSELADGVVDFADVIKLDEGTTLQVIPAGDPNLNAGIDAPDKFMRIFEALTQTYDCVVLHADMDCIEDLMPALKFELPVAVAVLPPKTAPEDAEGALSIVQHLGCPIVLHGDPVARKRHRFSLFGSRGAG
jgi:Mrp family chromosome partitioning ATPase